MTFDAVNHRDGMLVYPIDQYPNAVASNIIVGEALRSAFVYARSHSTMIFDTHIGWDNGGASLREFRIGSPYGTSAVPGKLLFFDEHVVLPTHISDIACYYMHDVTPVPTINPYNSITSYTRLVVTDGVTTATGAYTATTVQTDGYDVQRVEKSQGKTFGQGVKRFWKPKFENSRILDLCSVNVKTIAMNGIDPITITLEGYTETDTGAVTKFTLMSATGYALTID